VPNFYFLTKPALATQFAPQGNQAERSESEQRNCRAAIGNTSPSDYEREVLVRSSPPRPYVGARRHAETGEGNEVVPSENRTVGACESPYGLALLPDSILGSNHAGIHLFASVSRQASAVSLRGDTLRGRLHKAFCPLQVAQS
jgi:hypothetical protein